MAKRRVGVVFGGKSAEHEVSILSATNVLTAIDRTKYEVVPLFIAPDGKWYLDADASHLTDPSLVGEEPVELVVGQQSRHLEVLRTHELLAALDVVFPVLHGTYGEDGTVQGLLEIADVSYVGPGVLSSSVCMDKDVAKRLLRHAEIAVADWVLVRGDDFDSLEQEVIIERLGLPLFVKPANLGSSVGVSKVAIVDQLRPAIESALQFDDKVLVESAVRGREVECAVLGNDSPEASPIGEIIPTTHEFYDYEAKYLETDAAELAVDIDLEPSERELIQQIAVRAFQTLECAGMARVDGFLTGDRAFVVNEVNTIPGFTNISMYPKLWQAAGMSYPQLIDRLLELAIERHQARGAKRFSRQT